MINMSAEGSLQTETAADKRIRLAAEKKQKKEEEAAAKAAAKQKQEEEKKAKEAEEKAKKDKPKTLKELTEDYGLKEIDKLLVPAYFHRKKRYMENAEEKVDLYHAKNFLYGLEVFEEQGSCSAKITYIGPNRKYTLNNVLLAKREARPTHNNWKPFLARIVLFKAEGEHSCKIKDPRVTRDLLTTQGGKVNFKIRFVQDKEFTPEEVKKKVFHGDPVRLRNLNYRVKLDHAKMGIKPVLQNKDEALLLLKDIKAKVKDKSANHVIKFLQEEISKYTAIQKKKQEEAKKD